MTDLMKTLSATALLVFSAQAGLAQDAATDAAAKVTEATEQAADTVGDAAKDVVDGAAEMVKDGAEAVKDAVVGEDTKEAPAAEGETAATETAAEAETAAEGDAATDAPAEEAPAAEAATETPAADGETAAPAGDAPAGDAAAAEGEVAEGGVGTTYTAENHTDWERRCVRTEDGNDPCQLYQLLQDADGNDVAEITVIDLPGNGPAKAGLTITTPLETLLSEQITLTVDGTAKREYPFTFCMPSGCVSRIGFTEPELNQFKRGAEGQISIVPLGAPDQNVDLKISLSGFTSAFTAMAEANAATR